MTAPEMTVVGTHPSSDDVENAREYVTAESVDHPRITQLSKASWQLEVPSTAIGRARTGLQRHEQSIISDAWW